MQYLCLFRVWNKITIKNPYEKTEYGKMEAVFLAWFFMVGKLSFEDGNKPISYLKSKWNNENNYFTNI